MQQFLKKSNDFLQKKCYFSTYIETENNNYEFI
jgi:hypothetical protein